MNAEAHVHELKFTTEYGFNIGAPVIMYGDQTMKWPTHGPFKEARRARKVRRIVARHDEQSILAGGRATRKAEDEARYSALAREVATKAWGEPAPAPKSRADHVIDGLLAELDAR